MIKLNKYQAFHLYKERKIIGIKDKFIKQRM